MSAACAILILLAACDVYYGGDRGPPMHADASVPADVLSPAPHPTPPPRYGCTPMGLLPLARTEAFTPDAPIRSAVLNELQDAIVGAYRAPFDRRFTPQFIKGNGGGFQGVDNPLGATFPPVLGSSATSVSFFSIPFEVATGFISDEFIRFGIDLFGNGGDITTDVFYYPNVNTAAVLLATTTETVGANWEKIGIEPFTPQSMAIVAAGAAYLRFRVSAVGAICVGDVIATFQRLP